MRNNASAYGFSVTITASFGLVAWPVGAFAATSAYLFLFGAELGLIERLTRGRGDGPKG